MATGHPFSRRRLLGAWGTLAATLVAACAAPSAPAPPAATAPAQPKAGEPKPTDKPAAVAPAAATPKPVAKEVTIRFSQSTDADSLKAWNDWFGGPFKERNPRITVTVESAPSEDHHARILAQAASKTLPDTLYTQGPFAQQFIKNGVFVPLDTFWPNDAKWKAGGGIDDFFAEGVRPYQKDGKTYALPYDFGPACLIYYKPLFDQMNVEYPTNEWTFDDFKTAAIKLTRPGETWATEKIPVFTPTGFWQFEANYLRPWGGRIVNDAETEILIDSPEAQAALQYWLDLTLTNKAIMSVGETKTFDQAPFLSKRVGMTWNGAWQVESYNKGGLTGQFDVVFMPKGPKERTSAAMGSGYGMSNTSNSKDESWIMIRETTDEGMAEFFAKRGRAAHARKRYAPLALQIPNIPTNAKAWIDAQAHGKMGQPISPMAPQIIDIANRELELLFVGKKSVKECVDIIKRECQPLAARNKA